MRATPPPTPSLDFDVGAPVACRGEGCGKLARVVIDPETERVVALVIEYGGLLDKKRRVVPLRAVAQAEPDTIRLDLDKEDLAHYPEYNETEYAIPSDDWRHDRYQTDDAVYWNPPYRPIVNMPVVPMLRQRVHEGIPSTLDVIGSGTPVRTLTGELGVVDHVLTSRDSGLITHLVVRRGALLGADARIVPIAYVTEIDDEGIMVELAHETWEELPEYRG